MINKQFYIVFFTLFLYSIQAQVGINTDTPNPDITLDVNGKTNVVQRIYLGGTDLAQGDPGTSNELIISGGSTNTPKWDVKNLPDGFGETFTMTYMSSGFDDIGADLGASGAGQYTASNTLNDTGTGCTAGNCWKVLSNLNTTFPIYKSNNKVNFTFQTVAQINSAGSGSYACGVFVNSTSAQNPNPPLTDFTLAGVRADVVLGANAGDYRLFNMNVTLENLAGDAGGKIYAVRVACRGRTFTTNAMVVGKPHASQTSLLNSSMSRSSLNVFVLESYQ